ncbi:MAG: hypothetical protein IPI01_17470 [Ignavibacteriae bacterium]|nr:hypothetical protein [Ignavibacteriota bacterium]
MTLMLGSPRLTPSMRGATSNLRLHRVIVVHAGGESFQFHPSADAIPLVS